MPGQVMFNSEGNIWNSCLLASLDRFDKGLCVVDSAGKAVLCDEAFFAMTGFAFEELIGQDFHDVFGPRRPDGARHSGEECTLQKEGIPDHIEHQFLWGKEGRRFNVEGLTVPVGDHGSPAICIFALREAVDPVKTDQSDFKDDEPLRNARKSDDQVFYVIEPGASRFAYVGPAYESLTGRKGQDANSKSSLWVNLVVEEDCSRAESDYRRLLAGARIKTEYRIQSADGSIRWMMINAVPLPEPRGNRSLDRRPGERYNRDRSHRSSPLSRRGQIPSPFGQPARHWLDSGSKRTNRVYQPQHPSSDRVHRARNLCWRPKPLP